MSEINDPGEATSGFIPAPDPYFPYARRLVTERENFYQETLHEIESVGTPTTEKKETNPLKRVSKYILGGYRKR